MQQQVIESSGLLQIPSLLKEKGAKSVLLITGNHLTGKPIYQSLKAAIDAPVKTIHPPDGLLQLSSVPQIEAVDVIVAIGGGKTLDFAKGIIHQQSKPVNFVAVPTTAGSGSEATPFAVFYSGKGKLSLDHPALSPQTVVLHATLLRSLPQKQKAISGADAFAQCVEAIWNTKSNSVSDEFALSGMGDLWSNLPAFVHSDDERLAAQLLRAAHFSGKAIAHTRTTGPHALSYYLTAHHNVPHGQAVAFFLPLFFLYNNAPEVTTQLQKIYGVLRVHSAEEAFEKCRGFFQQIGLASRFSQAGLPDVNIEALLQSVNQQRFANNPVPFDAEKLKNLIERYLL